MHLSFDLAAYAAAAALTWFLRRHLAGTYSYPLNPRDRLGYFVAVTHGAILGALVFGSANLYLSGIDQTLGKSILGALVGAIIAVEWFKAARGIEGSTGALLVPGLALGILIGRLGCYQAGLNDHTHGVISSLPWAVDQGDGILRHPVALYEALAMLPLLTIALLLSWQAQPWWLHCGFYVFAFYYALQRFAWEFLKPYAQIALGLNLFQWLCLGLAGYAVWMLRGNHMRRWSLA